MILLIKCSYTIKSKIIIVYVKVRMRMIPHYCDNYKVSALLKNSKLRTTNAKQKLLSKGVAGCLITVQ